jgi:hypothetical protein
VSNQIWAENEAPESSEVENDLALIHSPSSYKSLLVNRSPSIDGGDGAVGSGRDQDDTGIQVCIVVTQPHHRPAVLVASRIRRGRCLKHQFFDQILFPPAYAQTFKFCKLALKRRSANLVLRYKYAPMNSSTATTGLFYHSGPRSVRTLPVLYVWQLV